MEKNVLYGEQVLRGTSRSAPNWEAIRISLEVSRKGSFRAAAKHLGLSTNILRCRVTELERAVGIPLLVRRGDNVQATEYGEGFFAVADKMAAASVDIFKAIKGNKLSGEVRLAVTEGLGTFWISPRLMEFRRENPGLLVNINCAMKVADLMGLEADAAIQLERPTAMDLKVVKLGRLHMTLFASRSYLEAFGTPQTTADLVHHRIALQGIDTPQWRSAYDRLFPGVSASQVPALRTNTSSAHYWSIANGAGIGVLPTYARWLGAEIVPLELGFHEAADIWLAYRKDTRRIPRVARLIDWARNVFSPKKIPWFRDEYIPPDELMADYQGDPLSP